VDAPSGSSNQGMREHRTGGFLQQLFKPGKERTWNRWLPLVSYVI